MWTSVCTSAAFIILVPYFIPFTQGARLVYHNEDSLPDEIDLMELYLSEPSAVKKLERGGDKSKGLLYNPRMELYPSETSAVKRGERREETTKGLWFGPRLGRRKRSNGSLFRNKREDNELTTAQEEAFLKLLQDGPFALFSLKGGKRRSANFTPRLGRDSEESFLENFVEPGLGSYSRAPLRAGSQAPNNNGQSMSNFTPRLGRLAPPDAEQH